MLMLTNINSKILLFVLLGIKAGLLRTYGNSIPQETMDFSNSPQWKPLVYAISFMHSVVQERRKFGALGWNIPYEFNNSDWAACVQFFMNHFDQLTPKKVLFHLNFALKLDNNWG